MDSEKIVVEAQIVKRLVVEVPPDLHARAKACAAAEGVFLGDWLKKIIEEYLANSFTD